MPTTARSSRSRFQQRGLAVLRRGPARSKRFVIQHLRSFAVAAAAFVSRCCRTTRPGSAVSAPGSRSRLLEFTSSHDILRSVVGQSPAADRPRLALDRSEHHGALWPVRAPRNPHMVTVTGRRITIRAPFVGRRAHRAGGVMVHGRFFGGGYATAAAASTRRTRGFASWQTSAAAATEFSVPPTQTPVLTRSELHRQYSIGFEPKARWQASRIRVRSNAPA